MKEKRLLSPEEQELDKHTGILVVITGASGAGKDAVMNEFLKTPLIEELNLKRIITCTDRPPRPGEKDGVDYHFKTNSDLQKMDMNGELVEPITPTGTSNKATPKSEIERLLNGENLIWRIDPSRAAEISSGEFFKRLFPNSAEMLQQHTIVLFVTAPKEVVDDRRKRRDLDKYDPTEYTTRDEQEKPYLEVLEKSAIPINNLDGKLNESVDSVNKSISNFYDEIKK